MSDRTEPDTAGFLVHGRVQGVGFRASTRRMARELGLDGTVRNRRDGAVEVRVRGAPEAIRRMEAWLHVGPRGSRVERVERTVMGSRLPSGFHIIG